MTFSAVILAGGKSSRMGRDKAFLQIGGRTLLDRQRDTLVAAGAEEILISGRPRVDYSAFNCRVLTDEFPGAGPLAGVHSALKHCRLPLLLVLAVDLPAMSPEFLGRLLRTASPARGVVPRLDGRIEPLVAVYPRAALPLVEHLISQRDYAVHSFAAACVQAGLAGYDEIPDEFADPFKNLNFPRDVETISPIQ